MNEYIFWQLMGSVLSTHNTECVMLTQLLNWQCSTIQNTEKKRQISQSDTLDPTAQERGETAAQKPGTPQKTHSRTQRREHTCRLNDDNVWHFWRCQRVAGDEERRGDERRREKRRSLMIKLSPDLVFDRGRSRIAMTRHSCTRTHTRALHKWQAQLWPCQAT